MPVRRIAVALSLAALAALPAFARAAQGVAPSAGNQTSVLLGIEDDVGPAAIQLRGDLEFSQQRLTPGVTLSFVGSIGYSRFHDEVTFTEPIFGTDQREESTIHLVRFAPSARFSFGSHPVFRPYVDGSLGLYWASLSSEITSFAVVPAATVSTSDSDVSLFMRFAAGASIQVSPTFAVGAELGFMPYFGDIDMTSTSVLASATFRM